MERQKQSYTEQLLEWGRSGSFWPNLRPTEDSLAQIRGLQEQASAMFPDATLVEAPHLTLFYVNPKQLFADLGLPADDRYKEASFYLELTRVFTLVIFWADKPEVSLDVLGVDYFGGGDVLALNLQKSNYFERLASEVRDMMIKLITSYAASEDVVASISQDQKYIWLFSDHFNLHISLLTGVAPSQKVEIEPPKTVVLHGLNDGSVAPPHDDPLRWYIMPEMLDD